MRIIYEATSSLGVNIVIAIAVLVIAGVIVKRHFFAPPTNSEKLQQQKQMLLGTHINVPNVSWEQNGKSLVFFLIKDCTYCTSSAPFYRQIIQEAEKRQVKWLAILPNSVEEGKQYLQSLNLPIENVQSASLASYNIPGTPSLLFVNSAGIIKGAWLGAKPTREKEMLDELVVLFESK